MKFSLASEPGFTHPGLLKSSFDFVALYAAMRSMSSAVLPREILVESVYSCVLMILNPSASFWYASYQ